MQKLLCMIEMKCEHSKIAVKLIIKTRLVDVRTLHAHIQDYNTQECLECVCYMSSLQLAEDPQPPERILFRLAPIYLTK